MRGGYRQNAGRKKGFAGIEAEKARELIVRKLIISFEPIVDKAIEQATSGNQRAREWLADRAYGKLSQSMDVETDFEPFQVILTQYKDPDSTNTSSLSEIIS